MPTPKKEKDIKYPELAKFLQTAYGKWWWKRYKETGVEPTQKEFAEWLGQDQSSVYQWVSGTRVPNDRQKFELYQKVGPGVYFALGLAAPMPDHPALRFIAEHWLDLTDEQIQQILGQTEKFVKMNDELSENSENGVTP